MVGNEPCDPHKYISMTESDNKQLSEFCCIEKQCPPHACNTVCPHSSHTSVLHCIYAAVEPAAHCKDKCACVCVRADTLTRSF